MTTTGPTGPTQPGNTVGSGNPPSTPSPSPPINITTPQGGLNVTPKYQICNGHRVQLGAAQCAVTVGIPPGHTLDFGKGYTNGASDGKVGVYDPVPACAAKTESALEHCYVGYKNAYVTYCHNSQLGCGDGPTTCPPGESTKDCSVPPTGPPPGPCQQRTVALLPINCPPLIRKPLRVPSPTNICVYMIRDIVVKHENSIQKVPIDQYSGVNTFVVTSCMTAANEGNLTSALAMICDTSISLMHNEALSATIPQIDSCLKARGLLS